MDEELIRTGLPQCTNNITTIPPLLPLLLKEEPVVGVPPLSQSELERQREAEDNLSLQHPNDVLFLHSIGSKFSLEDNLGKINSIFGRAIMVEIFEGLKEDGSVWAQKLLGTLDKMVRKKPSFLVKCASNLLH